MPGGDHPVQRGDGWARVERAIRCGCFGSLLLREPDFGAFAVITAIAMVMMEVLLMSLSP